MEPGLAAQLLAYFTHWPERQTACGGCGAAPLTQQTWALTWQRATGPGRPPEAGGCRVQPWSCSGRGTEVRAQPLLGGAGATLTDPPALLSSCSLRTPSIRPPRWPHQTLDAGQMRPGGSHCPSPCTPWAQRRGFAGTARCRETHTHMHTCALTLTGSGEEDGEGVPGGGGLDEGVAMHGAGALGGPQAPMPLLLGDPETGLAVRGLGHTPHARPPNPQPPPSAFAASGPSSRNFKNPGEATDTTRKIHRVHTHTSHTFMHTAHTPTRHTHTSQTHALTLRHTHTQIAGGSAARAALEA